jgi:N-acetylmuramoyl-L-alanine amidase
MATTTTNPEIAGTALSVSTGAPAWPHERSSVTVPAERSSSTHSTQNPSQGNALQALLAFSALHEQVRRRKALAVKHKNFDGSVAVAEFEPTELFVLDEVLQLVAERAVAITGADGLAIALAENNEIVLRAAAGTVRPDIGARIGRDSAFSGACFQTAQIINCDDTEVDPRVNLEACRKLGARSMVAVPLCGRRRVIGVLEAFSSWPFGFNDTDIGSLTLLAELVVGALKPEDEDRFAHSAQVAAKKLEPGPGPRPSAAPAKSLLSQPPLAPTPAPPATAPTKNAAPQPAPAQPAAPVSVAPAKPAKVEIVPTPLTTILDVPAPALKTTPKKTPESMPEKAAEKASAPETAVALETAVTPETAAPALTLGLEPEGAKHRTGMLVLLVGIVLATAFAAGVWWKLKTAQLRSMIVQTQKPQTETPAPKPAEATSAAGTSAEGTNKDLPTPPVPGVPSADSAIAEQASSDTTSDTNEMDSSPATAQEMSKFPRVTGIRHWSSADSSTVVLDLEDQVQYEEHQLSNPDRYYYDLRDTQLAPELAGKSIDVGDSFLTRIRIAQPVAGMTRIVLETKAGANIAHPGVSLEPSPYRLVIQVHKAGTEPKGAVNLFPNAEAEKNKLAIVIPPPTKEDLQLRSRVSKMRIVVDAGHGGWDLGTVGRRGLLEKDLVLEIAQRLGKLLESRLGADVILTRNDDNYIPLDERAEIANQAQADLFVSVHANYSDLPSARGVETYYTNFFSAPGAKENGAKENGSKDVAKNAGAKNQIAPTLSAADLHERIEQSRRLAASVQRSLYGTLAVQNPGLRDRGVKEAGFVVLTESAMPGILAEVSFVSSPTDEQKLRSDGYREAIAEALYKGIARYAASSKNVKMASK